MRTWVPNKHGVKLNPWNWLAQNQKSLLHYQCQCHIVIQLQRVDKALIFWGKTWTSLHWWDWLHISCGTRAYNGHLYQWQKIKHTFNIQKAAQQHHGWEHTKTKTTSYRFIGISYLKQMITLFSLLPELHRFLILPNVIKTDSTHRLSTANKLEFLCPKHRRPGTKTSDT